MRELIDGLWQLPALVPNLINCYLIRTAEGDVLIDARTRWAAGSILRALRGRNLAMVALTHVHPDHQGAAAEVCQRFGVPLACHEDDAEVMEGTKPMQPSGVLVRAGDRVWSGPPHPVARRLQEGDHIGEWRVVHTPGHTMGHVSLFRERDRAVIVGDVIRHSFVRPGRLIEPPRAFCEDADLNSQSIRKLAELRPSFLCFGHGPPTSLVADLDRLTAAVPRLEPVRLAMV
jgi:glyoxylase-like metal-dependent hydrolase (beta-lactamase superfamily II)